MPKSTTEMLEAIGSALVNLIFALRITTVLRNSFFMAIPVIRACLETWNKSRSTFRQAIKLMDNIVEQVKIPYEGTHIKDYFYRLDDSPRPTLIIHGG
jgi:hypothetical protein